MKIGSIDIASVYVGELAVSQIYLGETALLSTTTTTTVAPTTTTTTTTAAPASYSVSGAGTTAVNGTYTEAGTFNGKPYYQNGSYYILYDDNFEFFAVDWILTDSLGATDEGATYYYNAGQYSESSTPPTGAWNFDFNAVGSNPPPTVSTS